MRSRWMSFRSLSLSISTALTFAVLGCSGTQAVSGDNPPENSAASEAVTETADSCANCSVEAQLKQAAIASADTSLTVADTNRIQTDGDKKTALFGVEFEGVPVAGLSLRTREGNSQATQQIEFSDVAKGTSNVPALDEEVASLKALEFHEEEADVLEAKLVFLPTDVSDDGGKRVVGGLRLAWRVKVKNVAEEGVFPEISLISLDAQDGTLIESSQEASLDEGYGYARYSGFPSSLVPLEIAPLPGGGYELVDTSQGSRRTYSATGVVQGPPEGTRVKVTSDDIFFGNGTIAGTSEQAFANGQLTQTGETMAVDVHYNIGRSWSFVEQFFMRSGPYGNGDPITGYANVVRVVPYSLGTSAAYSPENKSLYVFLPPDSTPASIKEFKGGHPDILAHEFAHAINDTELRLPNGTAPSGVPGLEFQAIDEGLADVFSISEKNWHANPPTFISGHYVDGGAPNWESMTQRGFTPAYMDSQSSLSFYCRPNSVDPECSGWPTLEDLWNSNPPSNPNANAVPHRIGGIVRQLFYYMAMGSPPDPDHGGSPSFSMSPFLRKGVAGMGFMNAAQFFYNTVNYSSTAYPTFTQLAAAFLNRAVTETGVCSDQYKNVWDVLRAVNLKDAPIDRTPPTSLNIAAVQSMGQVNVTLTAVDPVDDSNWNHSIGRAVLKVNGTAVPAAYQPQFGSSTQAVVHFPISFFPTSPSAIYSFFLEAEDNCKNVKTKSYSKTIYTNRNVVITQTGAAKQPKLTVTLSDGGAMSSVKFTSDNGFTYTDTSSPFEVTLDTSTWSDGPHTITVLAKDTANNEFEGTKIVTADNTAPVVTLASSGSQPPFQLTATATDASPLVQSVFTLDGTPFSTDTTAPFNATYSPANNNAHVLAALVGDSYGNVGTASIAAPRDTIAPNATLTAQQTGLVVQLSATGMTDTCGVNWSLFVDGTPIVNGTASSWTGQLPTALVFPGTHLFSADLSDNCGNTRHVEQSFFINSIPTVTIDPVTVDPAHPKRPKVTVRVIHDRPIVKIEVWRTHGVNQTLLKVGEWTSATGELLPIREFIVNTSAVGWVSGSREIQAIAYDNIGIPANATTQVFVDNTAPAIPNPAWSVGPTTLSAVVSASDSNAPSVDSMKQLKAFMLFIVPDIIRNAAPWQITLVATPHGASFPVILQSEATDKFGNKRTRSWSSDATCSFDDHDNVTSCTYSPPSSAGEEVLEHEDP